MRKISRRQKENRKKTNSVRCGAVHSVEFEQNEDANLHHSLSVLPRVPRK